eukprot:m.236742 g.236742  ORF g.236742 m.236742 type:complete len:156 (+) comp10901_c0_seq1:860-1327(+)
MKTSSSTRSTGRFVTALAQSPRTHSMGHLLASHTPCAKGSKNTGKCRRGSSSRSVSKSSSQPSPRQQQVSGSRRILSTVARKGLLILAVLWACSAAHWLLMSLYIYMDCHGTFLWAPFSRARVECQVTWYLANHANSLYLGSFGRLFQTITALFT